MVSAIFSKRQLWFAPLIAVTVGLTSCGGGQAPTETSAPEAAPSGENSESDASASLTGAGASFPAPLYQTWFSEYNKENPNVQVTYQSVGSGAGVEQFIQNTVDFGASDVAMTDDEIGQVDRGVAMLPMTAGSIVLAYNLPDVEELRLSRQVYTDILLGNITNWNDPAIAEVNPDVELPDSDINVVHRSDGSGTTGVFTQHLSAIRPEWEQQVGSGKTVEWPVGIGAKGNEGVTAQIQQTEGSLGYIEYGYAKQQDIPVASLENKAGNYISPNVESAGRTLEAVTLPENLREFITDPDGDESYPIVTYTWLLAYENYDNPDKLQALKDVVNWSLEEGQTYAEDLGYVPLPDSVVQKVEAKLDTIQAQ